MRFLEDFCREASITQLREVYHRERDRIGYFTKKRGDLPLSRYRNPSEVVKSAIKVRDAVEAELTNRSELEKKK